MKSFIFFFFLLATMPISKLSAQSYEAQQLLLDWAKLSQLKGILSDMKKGYQIVSKGYSTIQDISKGNFNLHEAFLDGLWQVSPSVRKYWKIPQIISQQLQLVKEYKSAFNNCKNSHSFSADELVYIGEVYGNLVNQSLKDIDDLTTLLTPNETRMSDDERMGGIDKVFDSIEDKLQFLRSFNNRNSVLILQRTQATNEINQVGTLYGVNK